MAEDVKVEISIEAVDKITTDLNRIAGTIKKIDDGGALKGLSSAFTGLGSKIVILNQGLQLAGAVYRRLSGVISEATKAAAEQEKQESLLIDALKLKGKYTEELFQNSVKLASAMQQQTVFADEQIVQTQRQLVQLGVETSQLEAVTRATLDLASAKGMDLSSAADLVAKSVGSSTNALSRYGIQISDSKDKTQRASEIIAGISKLFGGAAQAEANTYAGSIQRLTNVYDEISESLGRYVTQNTVALKSIDGLSKIFVETAAYIDSNREAFNKLTKDGVIFLINGFGALINIMKLLSGVFISIIKLPELLVNGFLGLELVILRIIKSWISFGNILGKANKEVAAFEKQISLVEIAIKKSDDALLNSINTYQKISEFADMASGSVTDLSSELNKVESKEVTVAVRSPAGIAGIEEEGGTAETQKAHGLQGVAIEKTPQQYAQETITAITTGLSKGAEGAGQAVVAGITMTLTALIGPMGQAFQPLLDMFLQGPEKVKEMVDGFVAALPMVLETLVEGALQFVISVIDNLDLIIYSLLDSVPKLIDAVISSLPKIIDGILKLILDPKFYLKLAEGLLKAWLSIATAMGRAIVNIIKGIWESESETERQTVESEAEQAKKSIQASKEIGEEEKTKLLFDLESGVASYLEQLGAGNLEASKEEAKKIKDLYDAIAATYGLKLKAESGGVMAEIKSGRHQTGFDVPNVSKYTNDRYPANLSAGESVLTKKTTDRINDFLNTQNQMSTQPMIIKLQVGEKDLAEILLDINRRGYRTA